MKVLLTKSGQRLSYLSAGLTVLDGSINGFENHHYADLAIGVGLTLATVVAPPVGLALTGFYVGADITSVITTGESVTERLFDN